MGIFSNLTRLAGPSRISIRQLVAPKSTKSPRQCHIESMEPRQMLTADLLMGSVYFEEATGDDTAADTIQVTFQGGAPGTTLDFLLLDGDKTGNGLSTGDVFFDTSNGGLGAFGAVGLTILSHDGFDITNVQVIDGGTQIIFGFHGFDAGEILSFSIDVDEIQYLDEHAIDTNALVEGAEFQRSILTGRFSAPKFEDISLQAIYWDAFDTRFSEAEQAAGSTLQLPDDQYSSAHDYSDRTAGAVAHTQQTPLPTIAGTVFHDHNLNNQQNIPTDEGIAGVELALWIWDDASGDYRDTGMRAITDSHGNYLFEDTGGTQASTVFHPATDGEWTMDPANGTGRLLPGRYQVREIQPSPYFSVGAAAGTIEGVTEGIVLSPDIISEIDLSAGQDSIHNDFAEALMASIRGRVHLNMDGNCDFNSTDLLMSGVRIDLLDPNGTLLQTTHTNQNGEYSFNDLRPDEYQVYEHTPAAYNGLAVFDGNEFAGTSGGEINANDTISQIRLASGVDARDYNFCEHIGATISGWVYHDADNDGVFDSDEDAIGGAVLELLDANGNPTGVVTNSSLNVGNLGYYEFSNLAPGTWGVEETTPNGYLDGLDQAGTHGGTPLNPGDRITGAILGFADTGQRYNFGEVLPSSISGRVHVNTDGDCIYDPTTGDILFEGVSIDLVDADGNLLATQITDIRGEYLFDMLPPGTYQIIEHQPTEFHGTKVYDGIEWVGTAGGEIIKNDHIGRIVLNSGTDATRYDFCEHLSVTLSGYVYHDSDNDGVFDAGEDPIAGVTLKLLDENGDDTGIRAITAANGLYQFTDLAAGTYGVQELHPTGWMDGIDTPGNRGGTAEISPPGDKISGAVLSFGQSGEEYNFGELLPGSIAGHVRLTTEPTCTSDPNATPLKGISIDLLDEEGNIIASTITDDLGAYQFTGLRPGSYSVHEHQPMEYFDGSAHVGTGGGVLLDTNTLADIVIQSRDQFTQYDFCEHPAGSISGYVFQDGPAIITITDLPDDISTIRDGQRTSDDRPLSGIVLELHAGTSTEPIYGSQALPGTYPCAEPIRTVTDAKGFYEFVGLPGGTYSVVEVHPDRMIDGIDTEGSHGGHAINPHVQKTRGISGIPLQNQALEKLIETYRMEYGNDAIVLIPLPVGAHSVENNFSEIATEPFWLPPDPDPDPDPEPEPDPPRIIPYTPTPLLPQYAPLEQEPPFIGSSLRVLGSTWHLSIIDAGYPRSIRTGRIPGQLVGTKYDLQAWRQAKMNEATWTRADASGDLSTYQEPLTLGNEEAIPVTGDWNGDGVTEIGVFWKGEWFLDVNGNGIWDEGDLWAKLGAEGDRPVTGDWDGDGKADIGIFGPTWPGDPRALAHEPGLPDPQNIPFGKAKNVPPDPEEATFGTRMMKVTAQGRLRADLIDHVFHFGNAGDHPVAGDWNGDGITTIGVFREGIWYIDRDGDGRYTPADGAIQFGGGGDIPVVGDWNGDGIDDMGIYRSGKWILDSDGDHQLTAHDRVFELGMPGDMPAVGDWDGDGADDPAVYHPRNDKMLIGRKAM